VRLVLIKFLGTHNAESKNTRLVSFLIDGILAVDAGSLVSELTFDEQREIGSILLSHGHYDHIRAIPAFAFNNSDRITKVLGTRQTLEIVSSHLMDNVIYPEFTSESSFLSRATIELVPVEPFNRQVLHGYEVRAVPVRHPLNAVGFEIIAEDGKNLFYTGDTGGDLSSVWEHISPQLLIIDVTFPNRSDRVAGESQHLCPEMLKAELLDFHRTKGYLPSVVAIHLSPQYEPEITAEIEDIARSLGISIAVGREGEKLVL
jgi:ribonuclease BN (tRNA processing enzyme)